LTVIVNVGVVWLQEQKQFRASLTDEEGLKLTDKQGVDKKQRYWLIHTPFWRLCVEAERVGLKMPLKDVRSIHSLLIAPPTMCH